MCVLVCFKIHYCFCLIGTYCQLKAVDHHLVLQELSHRHLPLQTLHTPQKEFGAKDQE